MAARWEAIASDVQASIRKRLLAQLEINPGLEVDEYARPVGVDSELAAHVLGLAGACRDLNRRWYPPLPKSQAWEPSRAST